MQVETAHFVLILMHTVSECSDFASYAHRIIFDIILVPNNLVFFMVLGQKRLKKTVGKGEKTGSQDFFLFPTVVSFLSRPKFGILNA